MPRYRLLLAMVLVTAQVASATSPRSLAGREAWKAFLDRTGGEWQASWSPKYEGPVMLRPTTPFRVGSMGSPEGRALAGREFFGATAALFGIRASVDAMELVGDHTYGGMRFLKFQQLYRGIPVLSGNMSLAIDARGDLRMALGNVQAGITLETTPRITAEAARSVVAAQLGSSGVELARAPGSLAVAELNGEPRLCYRVGTRDASGMPLSEVVVDAHTGQVLATFPQRLEATGSGQVYPKDHRDPLTTVSLQRLDGTGEYLDGQNLAVIANYLASPRAHEPTLQYFYTPTAPAVPDATHFDEVNAYYQIDRFLNDFMKVRLGFAGIPNRLLARVNTGGNITAWDSVCDCPYTHLLGATTGLNDSGKDVDLIWHETTHAVLYSLGLGRPSLVGTEVGPLHEGMATYFACAFNEDPVWGEATYLTFPAGAESCTTSPTVFNYSRWGQNSMGPSGPPDTHSNGAIWSGALWDMRTALGWTADSLALQALFYMSSQPDFVQAAYAYLQADIDFHGGQHVNTIVAKFAARGINVGVLQVNLTSPTELNPNQWGNFNSNRTGGLKPFTYVWEQEELCSCVKPTNCDFWFTLSGTGSTIQARSPTSFWLRVTATDSLGKTATDQMYVDVRYVCDGGGEWEGALDSGLGVSPSPARNLARVTFGLAQPGHARVEIFDLLGRRMAILADRDFEAGPQNLVWSTRELAKGMYVMRLSRKGRTESARFVVAR